jgi:hypothetical protein
MLETIEALRYSAVYSLGLGCNKLGHVLVRCAADANVLRTRGVFPDQGPGKIQVLILLVYPYSVTSSRILQSHL